MIAEPQCSKRWCKHFLGVRQPDDEEVGEFVYCLAFPNGIPEKIAYGDNKHTESVKGDNGIQYEIAKEQA